MLFWGHSVQWQFARLSPECYSLHDKVIFCQQQSKTQWLPITTNLIRLMLIWDQNWSQSTACSHFQCWLRHSWRSTPHYPILLLLRLFERLFTAAAQVLTARRYRMSDETLNLTYFCGHSLM